VFVKQTVETGRLQVKGQSRPNSIDKPGVVAGTCHPSWRMKVQASLADTVFGKGPGVGLKCKAMSSNSRSTKKRKRQGKMNVL
jgi:hypothetical protein